MAFIFDEQLGDELDDGNARRCWFLNLRVEKTNEYAHLEQIIDALKDFELPYVAEEACA